MKINEFINQPRIVKEIERLNKHSFLGGKKHLNREYNFGKTIKKLPGGSGLLYSVEDGHELTIRLWDPKNKGEFQPLKEPLSPDFFSRDERTYRTYVWNRWKSENAKLKAEFDRAPGKLIGELVLGKSYKFPLKNALYVEFITIDEDYRGMGLAKALYDIVLSILKRPIIAGSSQTPGGRSNWVSLSKIPGVEVKGYFYVFDDKLDDKTIDIIMGKLGAEYIGKVSSHIVFHYFAFDVQPNSTKKELEAYVKTKLSQIYNPNLSYVTGAGLYAIWTGK